MQKPVFLLLVVVVVLSAETAPMQTRIAKTADDVRSERYADEVQQVARRFAQQLQETREFRFEDGELFTKRFVDCHLRTELERNENAIFSQVGISIPPEIASHAREQELRRYLVARLNFFHLKTLHRLGTRDLKGKWGDSFYTPEQEYPPGVYDLLMKNPEIAAGAARENNGRVSISASVKNVSQLRSVLPTLEQAVSAMRQHFMVHPPEQTDFYKANIERIGNKDPYDKFWKVSFQEISDKHSRPIKRCLGFTTHLIAPVKVPPFYRLLVLREGKRFRIGTMLCTEPPCVD